MAKDVIITPLDGDIQFSNASGTDAGKIEQSGDDLVISNAVGDVLLGDGNADVYIGDGTANVDIVFEQDASIRGEVGGTTVLTFGSSDTTLKLGSDLDVNGKSIVSASNGDITIMPNGTGKVGVGTTTPSTKLEVNGPIKTGTGTVVSGVDTNTDASIVIPKGTYIKSDDGNYLRVVVGHTSGGVVEVGQYSSLVTGAKMNSGTGDFYVHTGDNTEKFRINSSGNVGIGTSLPSQKLDVSGGDINLSLGNHIRFGGELGVQKVSGGSMNFFAGTNSTTGGFNFSTWNGSTYDSGTVVIRNSGNVGIGQTSPTVPLEVIGTIKQKTGSGYTNYVQQSVSEAQLTFSTYSNNQTSFPSAIKFSPNGTEAVRIDNDGNVGIGTSTPSTKLDVNGVITATGGSSTDWNNAYSWGDHSAQGYLTSETYSTPTELLTAIKTVDGSGSGLDADLIDGLGSYQFLRSDAADWFSGKLTYNGGEGSDALDLGVADINNVRQLNSHEYRQIESGVPRSNLGEPTVTEMALFDEQFTCKTGLNNDYDDLSDLTFWYQTNDGDSWVEQSETDDEKRRFLRTSNASIDIPYGTYKFRVEFHASGYTYANALYAYWTSQGHSTRVHVWKKRCSDGTWIQNTDSTQSVNAWPGHLWLPFPRIPWHETNTTSDQHFTDIRIEFTPTWNSTYPSNAIRLAGGQIWGGYPAGRRTPHRYDQNGKLITWGDLEVDGNVGIGTSSPSDTLQVNGTFRSNAFWTTSVGVSHWGTGSTAYGGLTWGTGYATVYSQAGNVLHLGAGGATPDVTINSSGNVGIGTTSPNQALHVVGNTYSSGTIGNKGTDIGQQLELGSSAVTTLRFDSDAWRLYAGGTGSSGELVRVTEDGNVGIGTAAPSYKLTSYDTSDDTFPIVAGAGLNTSSFTGIGLSGYVASNGAVKAGMVLQRVGNYGTGDIHFLNNSTENNSDATLADAKMTIKEDGKVGIGTTSPSALLEVESDIIKMGAGTAPIINIEGKSTTNVIRFRNAGGAWLGTQSNGINIGDFTSGVTTSYGDIRVGDYDFEIIDASNNRLLHIDNTTGKVGIGTTSPDAKLSIHNNGGHTSGTVSSTHATIDLYNPLEADTDEKGSIITFSDNYYASGSYTKTTRAAIKGGTDTAGNTANGFLAFYTDSAGANSAEERMRIDKDGNVGIGTTSPSAPLHVVGNKLLLERSGANDAYIESKTTAAGAYFIANSEGSANYYGLELKHGSTGKWFIGSYGNSSLEFKNGSKSSGTVAFAINSSNNVGIGTASPSAKLDVAGDTDATTVLGRAKFTSHVTDYLYLSHFDRSSSTDYALKQSPSGSTALNAASGQNVTLSVNNSNVVAVIGATSNVGIGTNSPSEKLHVSGNVRIEGDLTVNGSYTQIDTDVNTTEQWNVTNDGTGPAVTINQKGAQDIMDVQDDGVSVFYIEDGGNVGVGTTAPSAKLQVAGSIRAADTSYVTVEADQTDSARVFMGVTSATAEGFISVDNDRAGHVATDPSLKFLVGGGEKVRILDSGNVGIGTTSPSSLLEIDGGSSSPFIQLTSPNTNYSGIRFGDPQSSTAGRIQYYHGDDSLQFDTQGKFTFEGGNVGIGTTSPAARLQVNGSTSDSSANAFVVRDSSSASLFSVRNDGRVDVPNGVLYTNEGIVSSGPVDSSDDTNASITSETARFNKYGLMANRGSMYITNENASGDMKFGIGAVHAGATKMTLKSSGSLGIGTTNPSYALDIENDTTSILNLYRPNSSTSAASVLDFSFNTANATESVYARIRADVETNTDSAQGGDLSFHTANSGTVSEKLRITQEGNVGIGTTTPSTKLHILQSGTAVSSDGVSSLVVQKSAVAGTSAAINIVSGDSAEASLRFGDTTDQSMGALRYLNDVDAFSIVTNNTDQVRIASNGRVGIGTTSPTEKLHVNGDVKIETDLHVDGDTYGIYHRVSDGQYYFDDYQGTRNVNAFLKTTRSDIIKYQDIGTIEYWNGSSWVDATSTLLSSVEKLLDGRQDTSWGVPSTYYKFRFTVTASTSWPTVALIGAQTSWSGSTFPGYTMTVEEQQTDSSWVTEITADFTSANGVSTWGTAFLADNDLHTGRGGQTHATRITIDFYGWTPSNPSYANIPLQNIFIYSNYAGTEVNDYQNLLDYKRQIFAPNGIFVRGAESTDSGRVYFYDDDNSNYVSLESPATVSSNVALKLPSAYGSSGQFIQTDASGNLSFASVTQATGNELENLVEDTTPQLGGTLDANGNNIDMGTNVITDTKVGQWDTAYGWGNHASAGYLTALPSSTGTLTTFTNAVTIETNSDGILNLKQTGLGGTSGVKDGGWNYIQFLDSEGDRQGYFGIDNSGHFLFNPEVSGAEVKMNRTLRVLNNIIGTGNLTLTGTISASGYNNSNWDAAYGWGNHASAGYLTSETSHADVVVDGDFTSQGIMLRGASSGSYSILTDNSANWNTAYGWGDHSTQGYLTGITGQSIKNLSDVYSSMSPTDGQVLTYDTTNGWQAEDAAGGVTVQGTPSTYQLAGFYGSSAIQGDADLTWNTLTKLLDVRGNLKADIIQMNGRAPTSPAAGEIGAGANVITQFHTSGSVTAGVVYVAGSSAWVQADADGGSTSTGLIAVATDAADPTEMLIEGSVKLASNTGFSTASKGEVLYLSLTAGQLTNDISSYTTGDFVRVCGYVIDASKNYIYFKPDSTWIELS